MDKNITVYILSDSIGETGEQVTKAAISQFDLNKYDIIRFPYVSNKEHIEEILDSIDTKDSVLVYTLVVDELKCYLEKRATEMGIKTVDLISPLLNSISEVVGEKPKREAGIIRKLDEKYFKKIEAVEFAVKYDDGKDTRGIKKADVILLGISRTSKTPLSMYLANKNFKVANVPLVPEMPPPDELFEIDPKKIIGLTTTPEKLNQVRQERLRSLGLGSSADYASMSRIMSEIGYAENLMKSIGCPVIDVSNMAVEETANVVLEMLKGEEIEDLI